MNTQLIPVTPSTIGGHTIQTVNGRTLHTFLEVQSNFRDWIGRRIEEYDFKEDIDFRSFLSETPQGGRPAKEYALTLNMGKELAMVERTTKGKQARQYFIECEQRALAAPSALSNTLLAAQIAELFQGKVLVDTEILHTLRHRLDGVESIFQQLGAQLHQNPPRSTPNNVVQLFNKPSQAKLNRQTWEKPVQAFLANRTETTVTEVLNHIGIEPTHGHKKHMAQLLKSMNWQVNVILRANRTTRVYRFG